MGTLATRSGKGRKLVSHIAHVTDIADDRPVDPLSDASEGMTDFCYSRAHASAASCPGCGEVVYHLT